MFTKDFMALELIIVVDVLKIMHSSKLLVEQFRVLVYTNGLYNACTLPPSNVYKDI